MSDSSCDPRSGCSNKVFYRTRRHSRMASGLTRPRSRYWASPQAIIIDGRAALGDQDKVISHGLQAAGDLINRAGLRDLAREWIPPASNLYGLKRSDRQHWPETADAVLQVHSPLTALYIGHAATAKGQSANGPNGRKVPHSGHCPSLRRHPPRLQ